MCRAFDLPPALVTVRHDERLDAVIQLRREGVVRLVDVVQRKPVGDDLAGFQVPVANVLE